MKHVGKKSAGRRRGVALLYAVFGVLVAASMVAVMFTVAVALPPLPSPMV